MPLEDKDIIQIDATVITGLLFFLTLGFIGITPSTTSSNSSSAGGEEQQQQQQEEVEPLFSPEGGRVSFTLFLISPFVFSALLILAIDGRGGRGGNGGQTQHVAEVLRRVAKTATAMGFVFIIAALIMIFAAIELSRLWSS
jgi:hypothetical protein